MKNINTLIEDKKEIEKTLDNFAVEVRGILQEYLFDEPKKRSNLRLSAIGKPDRQLWYDLQEGKKEKYFDSPTRIKFLYGHLLESLLLTFTKLAGHTVTEEQKEISVAGVLGHQDCRIDVMLLYLMGSLVIISFLLVAFIVRTSIIVGLILMGVKDCVVFIMRKVSNILRKLREYLTF